MRALGVVLYWTGWVLIWVAGFVIALAPGIGLVTLGEKLKLKAELKQQT